MKGLLKVKDSNHEDNQNLLLVYDSALCLSFLVLLLAKFKNERVSWANQVAPQSLPKLP